MSQDPAERTFAAVEKREWTDAGVARSYARSFATASDMVVPHLVAAVAVGGTAGGTPGGAAGGAAGGATAVLDLCCGHGNVSAALAATGADVTAVDFSPVMLDMARRRAPSVRFVEGNAEALGFADESFDAVTIGFGIPHVPDPPKVLSEVRRVLRPGGRLAFSVWCGPEVDTALGYVFGAIARHGAPDITLPPGPGANDYADPAIARPALDRAGFSDVAQETVASHWWVDDPGAPFDYFRDGTARGGALLRPQPAANARAIRAAVVATVLAKHGGGPRWRIPIPAIVTSATAV